MTDYAPRELTACVDQALRQMPVVILSGLRQTGKSTLLLHDSRFSHRKYLSLDDFAILSAAQQNPEGLFSPDEAIAFEIKSGTRWDRADLANLHAFMERTPQCVASVLAYNGMETVALGPKLWAIPLGRLLS